MFRRSLSVLAAAGIALAAQVALPQAAQAGAYGCAGSLVGTWKVPLKDALSGKTYYRSDIKLYYNASNGWNCAVLAKRPGLPRYGERTPLWIEMYNSRWAEDNWKNNYDQEQGKFKYYAGPVKVYGKNLCLSIRVRHADHGPGGKTSYNGGRNLTGVACR
ncbi:hypothetical protein DP939_01260 [Spongiactinospora rosea]|uniref:Secreted protein n=1 Tax=Spongiactinospora rosea TaxID=2248750 RepID=A0A366M585_9ACTN|nr:hypothetical protein [Spongiactinospora rosea]RBQ21376.1 hypothetical protein DP939_01260 [Spongiactinospora rosea]